MRLHLVIQERKVEISSETPCLHFVETAPSVLRNMPWIMLKEYTVGMFDRIIFSLGAERLSPLLKHLLNLCPIMCAGVWTPSEF